MKAARLIREARRAAGLSQRELARAARTSQPTLARYEKGKVTPSLATLERILRAAGSRLSLSLEPLRTRGPGPAREALERNRDAVLEVLARYGATGGRLFGSTARGEDQTGSDLDLIVDMPEPTYVRLAALRADLEDVLGVPVDVTVEALLAEPTLQAAKREAVAL